MLASLVVCAVLLSLAGESLGVTDVRMEVRGFFPTEAARSSSTAVEWRFLEGLEGDYCAKCEGDLLRDVPHCSGHVECFSELQEDKRTPLGSCNVLRMDHLEPPLDVEIAWVPGRQLHAAAVEALPVGYYLLRCGRDESALITRTVSVGIKPFAFNTSLSLVLSSGGWRAQQQIFQDVIAGQTEKSKRLRETTEGSDSLASHLLSEEARLELYGRGSGDVVVGGALGVGDAFLVGGVADLAACLEEAHIVVVAMMPAMQETRGKLSFKPKRAVRRFWESLVDQLDAILQSEENLQLSVRYRLLPLGPAVSQDPVLWVVHKHRYRILDVFSLTDEAVVTSLAHSVVDVANEVLQEELLPALDDVHQTCITIPPGEKRSWFFPICHGVPTVRLSLAESDNVTLVSDPSILEGALQAKYGSVVVNEAEQTVTYTLKPAFQHGGVIDIVPVLLRTSYDRYIVDTAVLQFLTPGERPTSPSGDCIGSQASAVSGDLSRHEAPGVAAVTLPSVGRGGPSPFEQERNYYCATGVELEVRARELTHWPQHRALQEGMVTDGTPLSITRAPPPTSYSSCAFDLFPDVDSTVTLRDLSSGLSFTSIDAASVGLTERQAARYKVPPSCSFGLHLTAHTYVPGEFCIYDRVIAPASTGDFDGDGFPDLFLPSAAGGGRLYRNLANGTFEDVSRALGIASGFEPFMSGGSGPVLTSAMLADFDNDGDVDIFCTHAGHTVHQQVLFIQQADGTFSEEGLQRGLRHKDAGASGVIDSLFGDFDGDGYLDIVTMEWLPLTRKGGFKSNAHHSHSRLYRNLGTDGPGRFVDVTEEAGIHTLNFWKRTMFHVNEGDYALSGAFVDLDSDGWLDLIWTGDFGLSTIFWNTGGREDGVWFVEGEGDMGISREENGMGLTVHDVNGDGLLDFYVSSIHADENVSINCKDSLECAFGRFGNKLYLNRGDRTFEEAAGAYNLNATYWSWACDFVDFDHDSDLDFFLVNGFNVPGTTVEDHFNTRYNYLFLNPSTECLHSPSASFVTGPNGLHMPCDSVTAQMAPDTARRYVDASKAVGFSSIKDSKGAFAFDYDNDGDQDILVAVTADRVLLYKNELGAHGPAGSFLKVVPLTSFGSVSWSAIVEIYMTKDTVAPLVRLIGGSSAHYQSQGESTAHFGLGYLQSVHKVIVRFPRPSRAVVEVTDVAVNRLLQVYDSGRSFSVAYDTTVHSSCDTAGGDKSDSSSPLPVESSAPVKVSHHNSFSVESLAPGAGDDPCIARGHLCTQYDNNSRGNNSDRIKEKFDNSEETILTAGITNDPKSSTVQYSANGLGNNIAHPQWGASGTLYRQMPAAYDNGMDEAAMRGRPSARLASNELCAEVAGKPHFSRNNLSQLHVDWGQFLAHDMTLANPLGMTMLTDNTLPIAVPKGDIVFDLEDTGKEVIRFSRTTFDESTGTDEANPRQQVNHHSSFLDGSNVYGPSEDRMLELREGSGGRLLAGTAEVTGDELLPMRSLAGLARDNPTGREERNLFVAGDHRANEQPGLLALHTLFLREHNRLCDELSSAHPLWSDEELFQRARTLIIGQLQAITVNEYLPALLGRERGERVAKECATYNETVRPDVANAFASAAFRFGHSTVGPHLLLVSDNGEEELLSLRDAFFIPEHVLRHGVDAVLRGQLQCLSREIDIEMVADLRNFLFGNSRHLGGLDLAALNIQRGRDHGLPGYAAARSFFGLPVAATMAELPFPLAVRQKLEKLYVSVEHIDLFVGGLLEEHCSEDASVGELFAAMIEDQFTRLCVGDRLWFSNGAVFSEEEVAELNAVRLEHIIRRVVGDSSEEMSISHCVGTPPVRIRHH